MLHDPAKLSVIYYSHNQGDPELLHTCLLDLATGVRRAHGELVVVTWKPVEEQRELVEYLDGRLRHTVYPETVPSHQSIYRQILAGCDIASTDKIFLAEHDVLYPNGYFDGGLRCINENPGKLCYNVNVYHMTKHGYFRACDYCYWMSNLCGSKEAVQKGVATKLSELRKGKLKWAEPGMDAQYPAAKWSCWRPTLDIRHGRNLTGDRKPQNESDYLAYLPYWGRYWEHPGFRW